MSLIHNVHVRKAWCGGTEGHMSTIRATPASILTANRSRNISTQGIRARWCIDVKYALGLSVHCGF